MTTVSDLQYNISKNKENSCKIIQINIYTQRTIPTDNFSVNNDACEILERRECDMKLLCVYTQVEMNSFD